MQYIPCRMPTVRSGTEPYYLAYDRRYRDVYARGVQYWTAFPDELAEIEHTVGGFLTAHVASAATIGEFGCGEGFVGTLIARSGFEYVGVDVSPTAVTKARERLATFGSTARVIQDDVTRLDDLRDASLDAALDVQCLHMLVVDADRRAYLRAARRVLKPGAVFQFALELVDPEVGLTIESYEQWCAIKGCDYDVAEARDAWEAGERITIYLRRVPARGRSLDGYREETSAAGFEWLESDARTTPRGATFAVRRP